MRDCVFSGKIGESAAAPFKTTSSNLSAGGVIGSIGSSSHYGPDAENCHTRAQAFFVEYTGTGEMYIGGFNGYTNGGAVSACSAEGAINLNKTGASGGIYFGGFTGYVDNAAGRTSEFVRCYATANLVSTSAAGQWVGGFLGRVSGNTTTVANCYATGDVSVTGSTGTNTNSVGGFVATSVGGTILNMVNCYATGDVTVNNDTSYSIVYNTWVGGIIGSHATSVTIVHCFAGGTVSVSSNSNRIYAGGIAGINAGSITNSAAYGGSVSASTSDTSSSANRIWGGTGTGGSNNYAFKTMRTGTASGGSSPITWTVPADFTTSEDNDGDGDSGDAADIALVPAHDKKNGENAVGDDFRSTWFWQNTLGFKASETITGTVNGTPGQTIVSGPAWGFSTVFGKGHPVLLNADGSVMGGQMAAP
jgi:hypothetical protein